MIKSHALGWPVTGGDGYPSGTWQQGQIKNVFVEPGEIVEMTYRLANDAEGTGLARLRMNGFTIDVLYTDIGVANPLGRGWT